MTLLCDLCCLHFCARAPRVRASLHANACGVRGAHSNVSEVPQRTPPVTHRTVLCIGKKYNADIPCAARTPAGTTPGALAIPRSLTACLPACLSRARACVCVCRWSEPDLERPFKVWMIVPVIFIAVSVFTVIVLLFISPATCSVGFAVLLLGLPVYVFHSNRLKKQGVVWSSRNSHADTAPLLVEEIDRSNETQHDGTRKLV